MNPVNISTEFRKRAWMAALSIVLFIFVYLILLALGIGIAVGLGYIAILLIGAKPSFFTLAIGVAMLAVGVFIVAFMVKFLFTRNKADYGDFIEIDLDREPILADHIKNLTTEIGTAFPKRVYLSPQVNASVFYDSSFWSMFLPIKKNLHIGMGLVNAATVSEFRGILAHEFGHFSQKSMKIGAYVYNVNRIIYNMLYENDSYDKTISSWAGRSNYFMLVTWVAVYYNKLIQFILKQVHQLVNLQHMALSREMEFHADAIAVNAVGTKPMIDSMLRMDLASEALESVFSHYGNVIDKNLTTQNVFPKQSYYMGFIASIRNLKMQDGLPVIDYEEFQKFNKSKLNIKDQWASHPTEQERVSNFTRANVHDIPIDNSSANTLFSDLETTQREITAKLFSEIEYSELPQEEPIEDFATSIRFDYLDNKFPDAFNGYYDIHNPEPFDFASVRDAQQTDWKNLYSHEMVERINTTRAMTADSETIMAIAEGHLNHKTFDYDGRKYAKKEAKGLYEQLQKEIAACTSEIRKHDEQIYAHFFQLAHEQGKAFDFKQSYKDFFEIDKNYEERVTHYMNLRNGFAFAYQTLETDAISKAISQFSAVEDNFKKTLRQTIENPLYNIAITPEISKTFTNYLDGNLRYFNGSRYDEEAIRLKNIARENYAYVLKRSYFLNKKKLLELQASLVGPTI